MKRFNGYSRLPGGDKDKGSGAGKTAARPALCALRDVLVRRIEASPAAVRLCAYDYLSGEWLEIGGHRPFYPASLIKTLILLAALEQVEQDRLSLTGRYTLREEDRFAGTVPVTGAGIVRLAAAGTAYTFEELLSLMIAISDNVAANIVCDLVGRERVNGMARKLSLKNTAFTRKMYELHSPLPSNVSTACDLTRMLLALENREVAGETLSTWAIRMMIAARDKRRIGRLIGSVCTVANKTGTVDGFAGDMALLYFPRRPPAALTVVVEGADGEEEAAALIGALAQLIVSRLLGDSRDTILN